MLTKTRTLGTAGLVAAGLLSLATAGYADDTDEGQKAHLEAAPAIRAVGSPAISKAVEQDSKAAQVRGRFQEKLEGLGRSPETLQELERLEAVRDGRLRASEQAFGGEDCGPGVRVPAGTAPGLSGCDQENDATEDRRAGRRSDRAMGIGAGPLGMRDSRRQGPDPRSFIGDGSSKEKPNAYIGGRSRSAKGRSGLKDLGTGRVQQGGSGGDDSGPDMVFDEQGRVIYEEKPDEEGPGYTSEVTFYFDDGSSVTYHYEHEGEDDLSGTPKGTTFIGAPEVPGDDDELGGGADSQPNPNDTGGSGHAPRGCTEPGTDERSCRQAIEARKSEYQKALEAAREDGDHHTMTPQEIFERVGQPLPPSVANEADARVGDRGERAGFVPGCDATPGGCGGRASEAGGAAAAASVEVDRRGIAGFTPGCDAMPGGCGGSGESRR